MDSDFRIDIGEVQRAIDVGEITALYFPLLRKTLLMDTRTTGVDGPMIKVVPMASSPEERFRDLVRMRPRLPKPESINIVPWPKYVASLVRLEVWDHIVRRFLEIGPPEIVKRCEECLEELKRLEREELRRAITGENYETLWDVAGTQEGAEVDDDDEELV
ncbi:MAG: hypothetical protein IIB87_02395 [Chloroflexi bacterium]|nr:hypothetical protein [Chloroflexota bacterium]